MKQLNFAPSDHARGMKARFELDQFLNQTLQQNAFAEASFEVADESEFENQILPSLGGLQSIRFSKKAEKHYDVQFAVQHGGNASVIVPVFNPIRSELEECIKSVQTACEFAGLNVYEIILVDDASDDSPWLLEIANQFANVRIFKLLKNQGPSIARNCGFRESHYEAVFFVDSDDRIERETILFMMSELKTGAILVASDMQLSTGEMFIAQSMPAEKLVLENAHGSGIALRKCPELSAALRNGGLYSPEMKMHYEDWELHIYLVLRGIIPRIIPLPLYWYRIRETGRNLAHSPHQSFSHFAAPLSAVKSYAQFSGNPEVLASSALAQKMMKFMIDSGLLISPLQKPSRKSVFRLLVHCVKLLLKV